MIHFNLKSESGVVAQEPAQQRFEAAVQLRRDRGKRKKRNPLKNKNKTKKTCRWLVFFFFFFFDS